MKNIPPTPILQFSTNENCFRADPPNNKVFLHPFLLKKLKNMDKVRIFFPKSLLVQIFHNPPGSANIKECTPLVAVPTGLTGLLFCFYLCLSSIKLIIFNFS